MNLLIGKGVEAKETEAIFWIKKATDGNDLKAQKAQFTFGNYFIVAEPKYCEEGLRLLLLAANYNHSPSQSALSIYYKAGQGCIPKDLTKSNEWAEKARNNN